MTSSVIYIIDGVVSKFMKVFDKPSKCFHDEFNRPKTDIVIDQFDDKRSIFTPDFHKFVIDGLMEKIDGLSVVSDDYESNMITRLNFRNCEVVMDYKVDHWGFNRITFTKLSYPGDTRDFEDY